MYVLFPGECRVPADHYKTPAGEVLGSAGQFNRQADANFSGEQRSKGPKDQGYHGDQ